MAGHGRPRVRPRARVAAGSGSVVSRTRHGALEGSTGRTSPRRARRRAMGRTARPVGGTSCGTGVRREPYEPPLIARLTWTPGIARSAAARASIDRAQGAPMAEDPFPRDRVAATLRRMPAYLRLAWRLARDPLLSRARRAAVIARGRLPRLAGRPRARGHPGPRAARRHRLRDRALKFALAGLDAERRREHLAAVGLEDDDLAEDLRTVGATSAWLVRCGVTDHRQGARGRAAGSRWAARASPVHGGCDDATRGRGGRVAARRRVRPPGAPPRGPARPPGRRVRRPRRARRARVPWRLGA